MRLLLGLLCLCGMVQTAVAQGIILPAGGPVNRAMGGASTAAPLDAMGAMYWNPATSAALEPEIGFGVDLLLPVLRTSSSVAGLGAGTTEAEPGVGAIPNIGWVHRGEGSRVTWGLGLLGLAGFKTNYPASTTNPIFAPQSNAVGVPGGLGRLFSEAQFLQIAPAMTIALSEQLAIGFGPTVTLGEVLVDPLIIGPVDDADGTLVPRYGPGRSTRAHWGVGAQAGIYYIGGNGVHLGASIKSPQWMETIRYFSTTELGTPKTTRFKMDLPMIASIGTAYSGIENFVFALDLRYIDYKNTNGFGQHGFSADGSLQGLGMSSVLAVAVGSQVRLGDRLYWRVGYTGSGPTMQDAEAIFGVPAPIYYQHTLHTGGSVGLSESVWLNFAYSYALEADLTGPILTAAGPVPGSSVTTTMSAHDLSLGVSAKY